ARMDERPGVVGRLVGRARPAGPRFFRPDIQIHLHRFLMTGMSRRRLLLAAAISTALLVLADRASRRLGAASVPRQLTRQIDAAPATIDVLGLGNSLMQAGLDTFATEQILADGKRMPAVVNGALGASGVIEHLALARVAFRRHRVRTIVYGFFDQQMAS